MTLEPLTLTLLACSGGACLLAVITLALYVSQLRRRPSARKRP